MSWQPELDELHRRLALAHEMGGADKVKRQHDAGRLTVRERIGKMVDDASFHEVGAISGIGEYDETGKFETMTPANCVFGRGRVDGRPVVVVGDDFTVRGGSADASISAKPLMAEEMAAEYRLPIIRIIEGSGGGGSVKTIETKGASNLPGGIGGTRAYLLMTDNLSQVPVVGLGLGSVAGLGAARLASTHFSVMTRESAMFVAGPPVVKRLGQDLTKQELGGAEIQTRSGAIDKWRPPLSGIVAVRLFDLDDLGAQIGQDLTGKWSGYAVAEFDHDNALKRQGCGRLDDGTAHVDRWLFLTRSECLLRG